MGKAQREKGAVAEREVFKIIREVTGIELSRNLEQYQESGSDCHIHGFCIEIKRQEKLSLGSWWTQVNKIAAQCNEIPVLIYRQSRQPWRVILPWASTSYLIHHDVAMPKWTFEFEYTQTVLLDPVFTLLLTESEAGSQMIAEAKETVDKLKLN